VANRRKMQLSAAKASYGSRRPGRGRDPRRKHKLRQRNCSRHVHAKVSCRTVLFLPRQGRGFRYVLSHSKMACFGEQNVISCCTNSQRNMVLGGGAVWKKRFVSGLRFSDAVYAETRTGFGGWASPAAKAGRRFERLQHA
jgi:hypothetical protein